ncbi:glutathione S-transferase [Pseudaestuariivita rosea]|uniref:glutathione S-transferase n=1 Tax=Pseudaestuariivita rosea TaxID=2763263 RepID=UPI001ABA30BC|nr:glutathione S-transferase [Pseudaestuariivita rosea]
MIDATQSSLPVLYSFRRCPYAMRARLAVQSAGIKCELREILLRDKAPEFLEKSPSATVPCLDLGDRVIDESLDIMLWALGENDPENLLRMPQDGFDLIAESDGPFKTALDRYKYSTRYGSDALDERATGAEFLFEINGMLADQPYLYGTSPTLADMAIAPFVRQFANTDKGWFDDQPWLALRDWLDRFINSQQFQSIMQKYPVWKAGDDITIFP